MIIADNSDRLKKDIEWPLSLHQSYQSLARRIWYILMKKFSLQNPCNKYIHEKSLQQICTWKIPARNTCTWTIPATNMYNVHAKSRQEIYTWKIPATNAWQIHVTHPIDLVCLGLLVFHAGSQGWWLMIRVTQRSTNQSCHHRVFLSLEEKKICSFENHNATLETRVAKCNL